MPPRNTRNVHAFELKHYEQRAFVLGRIKSSFKETNIKNVNLTQ